jgi:hypothetical protein
MFAQEAPRESRLWHCSSPLRYQGLLIGRPQVGRCTSRTEEGWEPSAWEDMRGQCLGSLDETLPEPYVAL